MYARINRYRGTKSKSLGCFFMALPALILVSISWGYIAYTTGFWYVLAYLLLFTLINPFMCLMWWHDSDAWRDVEAMRKQWFWKGLVSFTLLGNPFGYKLQKLSESYAKHFIPAKDGNPAREDKEAVELEEGAAWGIQSISTAVFHVALAVILQIVANLGLV